MNVLSLDPRYFSSCTHSAGRVYVSTCDAGHLRIQFLYPISLQVHVCSHLSWLGEIFFPYRGLSGLAHGKVEFCRALIGEGLWEGKIYVLSFGQDPLSSG